MSVTQSSTITSTGNGQSEITNSPPIINPNFAGDVQLHQLLQHTNAVTNTAAKQTTLQLTNSGSTQSISVDSGSSVVFVVPYQQQAEQQDPTSIWQRIQSIALILILIIALLTVIHSVVGLFTPSTPTTTQNEIAAASALATEFDAAT